MLPVVYFFSDPMTAPLRWAAFKALRPLTVVSRGAAPPRVLLPILVTVSQSLILTDYLLGVVGGEGVCVVNDRGRRWCA